MWNMPPHIIILNVVVLAGSSLIWQVLLNIRTCQIKIDTFVSLYLYNCRKTILSGLDFLAYSTDRFCRTCQNKFDFQNKSILIHCTLKHCFWTNLKWMFNGSPGSPSKKQDLSLATNDHTQRKPLYFVNTMTDSFSKSTKIWLSKSILFLKQFIFQNQAHFWRTVTHCILKT